MTRLVINTIFLLTLSAQPQSDNLCDRFLTLTDPGSNLYLLLAELRSEHSEDTIISKLVPALRAEKGFEEHFARVRGFTMLLELGMKPDGKRIYTNRDQVQLLLDELKGEDASSIQVQIINALPSVQVEDRKAFLAILRDKLKAPVYWVVRSSLQALTSFGNERTAGLTEARALLIDPAKANPNMIEHLRQFPDVDEKEISELISKLRSEATQASIALGGLAEDLALYPQLDEQGQAAASYGILKLLGCNCRSLPATVDEQAHAVRFAVDFYATPLRIGAMPNEAAGFLQRLASPPTDPRIRANAIEGLNKIVVLHPDPIIRDHIRSGLERIDSISSTNE